VHRGPRFWQFGGCEGKDSLEGARRWNLKSGVAIRTCVCSCSCHNHAFIKLCACSYSHAFCSDSAMRTLFHDQSHVSTYMHLHILALSKAGRRMSEEHCEVCLASEDWWDSHVNFDWRSLCEAVKQCPLCGRGNDNERVN
jgi:hypothetical protein